jgi:hypothetical protein
MGLTLLDLNGERDLLQSSQGINRGFTEFREAYFLRPSTGAWSLFIDDVTLLPARVNGHDVWAWKPGFYAGTVRAELIPNDALHGVEFLLDVSPDPAKVGQDAFNEMVQDIWAFDPILVTGEQAAHTQIATAGDRADPAVQFMRLSRNAFEFSRAMAQVRGDPHKSIRRTRRSAPLHLVRRADAQTARAAVRSLAALPLADFLDGEELSSPAGDPLYDVPISEPTLDTSANRTMSALVRRVGRAIESLSSELMRQLAQAGDDERKAHESRSARRAQILEALRREVERCLKSEPLSAVTREEITAAGLTAIAANPVYARAQQLIWKMLRIGFDQGELVERSAMSPTWAIYEAWCFIKIADFLQEQFPEWNWTRRDYGDRRYGFSGVLGSNHLDLEYQKQFSYAIEPGIGPWSISAQFIPDIVLFARTPPKHLWMVLDAKYRTGRQNVIDGMRSAHIYRDALRLASQPPVFSTLLLPAVAHDAAWLHDPVFQRTHHVGAVVCSRSQFDSDLIRESLAEFFNGR